MSSLSIPLLFVDEEEFQALEIAIAAAESTSNKKPKICCRPETILPDCFAASTSGCYTRSTHAHPGAPQSSPEPSSDLLNGVGCFSAADEGPSQRHVDCGNGGSCSKWSCIVTIGVAADGRGEMGCASLTEFQALDADTRPQTDKLSHLRDAGDTKHTISRHLPSWPSSTEMPTRNSRSSSSAVLTFCDEKQPSSALTELACPEASCAENRFQWGLTPSIHRRALVKSKLQLIQFKGEIKYSDTELDAENAAIELLREVEAKKAVSGGLVPLGFDAEWRVIRQNGFLNEQGAVPQKVAVLQLCLDAKSCNVFHIVYSGIPSPLKSILEDPSVLKVGVGADGDARKLFTDYNVNVKGVKDLGSLAIAKLGWVKSRSLASLTAELLGKQVDKDPHIRCGDWEARTLSKAQLQYAATDAFVSLFLFQALSSFPDRHKDVLPETGEDRRIECENASEEMCKEH